MAERSTPSSGRSTGPSTGTDPIETPGPWQHRYVAANGARFHVAEAGHEDAPLVLLLHGFPQLWWAWRHQLPVLAEAGYRVAAMDLRGYGGSDTTPRGYDPVTLAQDVSGVVKALGCRDAVLVGHGWGGYVGWATAATHPRQVTALAAVSAPHPLAMLRSLSGPAARHLLAMQLPWRPERRLANPASGFLERHLRSWSSSPAFPGPAEVTAYQRAMSRWPSSHCAVEYHRWLVRSRLRADGRAFRRAVRPPIGQPVLCLVGADDTVVRGRAVERSRRYVTGAFDLRVLPGVGHFAPEEDPAAVTDALLAWLRDRPR